MPVTPNNRKEKRAVPLSKESSRLSARKKKEAEYIAELYRTPTKRYGSTKRLRCRPQRNLAVDTDSEDESGENSSNDNLSSEQDSDSEVESAKDDAAAATTFSDSEEGSSDEDTAITSDEEYNSSDDDDDEEEEECHELSDYEEGVSKKRRRKVTSRSINCTPSKKQRQGLNSVAGTPRGKEQILENVTSTPHLPARPLNMTTLELADLEGLTSQARAKKLLHVGATPERLPCREDQYEEVVDYVEEAVQSGTGKCVYVSGVPGVGKTATIREAIRSLRYRAKMGLISPFKFVEINGMKLNDAQDAYSLLWQTLTGMRCSNKEALRRLGHHFSSSSSGGSNKFQNTSSSNGSSSNRRDEEKTKKPTTVVLMDELDQLVTTRQEVMYNMFNWPNSNDSRLIVIAVANTMDLPERILQPKVASRLGMERITFKPYNDKELVEIVHSRLGIGRRQQSKLSPVEEALIKDCDKVFTLDAIIFISKRVSNVSGDARRMLDVCRRSIDSVEMQAAKQGNPPRQVTIDDVKKVLDSMVKSGKVSHLIKLSLQAKITLISILACSRRSGVAECDLATILTHQRTLCRMQGISAKFDLHTISPIMSQLCSLGLLIAVGSGAGTAKGGMHSRFLLACQEDEVRLALEQDQDDRLRNMM